MLEQIIFWFREHRCRRYGHDWHDLSSGPLGAWSQCRRCGLGYLRHHTPADSIAHVTDDGLLGSKLGPAKQEQAISSITIDNPGSGYTGPPLPPGQTLPAKGGGGGAVNDGAVDWPTGSIVVRSNISSGGGCNTVGPKGGSDHD